MKKNKLLTWIVVALFAVTMYSLTPGTKTMTLEMPGIVIIQTK